ncbi:MAG: hypothetical protein FD169_1014 [Bacillota bacterium]|nr:MAG: hypothetical protein FD169_1014 [Bacillota bacterium]
MKKIAWRLIPWIGAFIGMQLVAGRFPANNSYRGFSDFLSSSVIAASALLLTCWLRVLAAPGQTVRKNANLCASALLLLIVLTIPQNTAKNNTLWYLWVFVGVYAALSVLRLFWEQDD